MIDFGSKTLVEIVSLLEEIKFDVNALLPMLDGEVSKIIDQPDYFKITVESRNSKMNSAVIDGEFGCMTSVYFGGRPNIQFSDIRALTNDLSETYSIRDELYFYTFNMQMGSYNFFISFYSSSQIDISKEGWLPNLSVALRS